MILRDFLVKRFNEPLPGEDSHLEMSPLGRGKSSDALRKANKIRESAVGIHVFDIAGDQPKILLTKRANYKGTHGGQISFPGGKKESDDPNLEFTARRESFEETGIPLKKGELLGRLTDIFIPVSGFKVQPYLFYHSHAYSELNTDSREVEELFFLPARTLVDDHLKSFVTIEIQSGLQLKKVPSFVFEERIIWGATAIILNELKTMLRSFDF